MARENMHNSFELYYEKIDCCPLRDRQFNFFEFVYVLSGKGTHSINGNKLSFAVGDFFLITPNDCHEFNLECLCEFMVIRFAPSYVKSYSWESIDHIECLLYHASHISGSILVNADDKLMINRLMLNLQQIVSEENLYNEDLTRHLINAIIVIAARNISIVKPKNILPTTDKRLLTIIDYIQTHICQPKLLRIAVIAEKFGLSPAYLGSYFRKQCDESIQHCISSYRIRLIEHRLQFSDKRVHEIADEFGFADESHINKFFKRHKGLSLRAYRDKIRSRTTI